MAGDILDLAAQGGLKRLFRSRKKIDAPGLVSHLTQRAAGKEPLFVEHRDYLAMLALMKELSTKYEMDIYAFCLLTNHMHILLSPKTKNLSAFMQILLSQYAGYFNRKYARKGHLFGGPYRQALCLDDSYFLAVSLYIHLNPVRAGLVMDPLKYRWSSCLLYGRKNPPQSFVNATKVLSLLSEDLFRARELYRGMLGRGALLHLGHALEDGGAVQRFLETLKREYPELLKRMGLRRLLPDDLKPDFISLNDLEERISQLRQRFHRDSPETTRARKYLIEQLLARGFARGDIARRLEISRKTLYNIMK